MQLETDLKTVVITGGSSGLGIQICEKLCQLQPRPQIVSISLEGETNLAYNKVHQIQLDLARCEYNLDLKDRIEEPFQRYYGRDFGIDVLINCAGVNEIAMIPALDWNIVHRLMEVNVYAQVALTKLLLNKLANGTVCNVVSNAAHIPMTGSVAYNMSKAASYAATQQMARELGKTHGITVFGVSPNKMSNTGMSRYIDKRVCETRGWTPEQARAYQLAALPAGEETPPEQVAEFIVYLLSQKNRHKYLQGCVLPYGGPTP